MRNSRVVNAAQNTKGKGKRSLTSHALTTQKKIFEKTKKPAGPWTELTTNKLNPTATLPMAIGRGENVNAVNNRNQDQSGCPTKTTATSPMSIAQGLGRWHHGSFDDLLKVCEKESQTIVDKDFILDVMQSSETDSDHLAPGSGYTGGKDSFYNSIELFRIHVMSNPMFARMRDERGNLPLHNAITRADASPGVVSELIKRYPDGVKTKDKRGDLPLFLACQQQKLNPSVIKALLQAFPEAASRKIFGSLAIHQMVYKRFDKGPNIEALKALIKANPDSLVSMNSNGKIPIQYVCENLNHRDAIELMAQTAPSSLTVKNKEGLNAIQISVSNLFTIDGKVKSLLYKKETLRLMLRCANYEELNNEEKDLFKSLNSDIRIIAFLLSHKCSEESSKLAKFCEFLSSAMPGMWREIVMYL